MAHPFFGYWKNGSEYVAVHADMPTLDEAKPFHVLVEGESWIPISVLVYARDEAHARKRVIESIRECMEHDRADREFEYPRTPRELGSRILSDLDRGMLTMHVYPYDVRLICAKVIWAANGGLF